MRKAILVLVVLFVFIGVTGNFCSSLAVELCPFLRFGTINWKEGDIDEGHKYLRGGGLEIKSNLIDGLRGAVTIQGWEMGEPLDEDRELPYKGYSFSGEIDYNWPIGDNFTLYPYIGLGFEKWKRVEEGNIKYSQSWNSLEFFNWSLGGKVIYKMAYLRTGLIFPFNGQTNDNLYPQTKIGFDFEVGVRWKKLTLGWLYKRVRFDEIASENIGHSDFELNRSGVIIKYGFYF